MLWFLAVVAALVVVVIALVAVGQVTADLSAQPPLSVFELEEAVAWVADELPTDTQGRLSYDDVRVVIGAYLDYLEMKGVAFEGAGGAAPSGPLVADDDEGLAFVIGRVADSDLDDVSDVDVAEVLTATEAFLGEIGALGGRVPTPPDPHSGSGEATTAGAD